MALGQSIPTPIGIPATYWRILTRHDVYTVPTPAVTITVGGFVNQAASDAGASPVVTRIYTMPLSGQQTFDNIGRMDAYTFLLTTPDFQGATSLISVGGA